MNAIYLLYPVFHKICVASKPTTMSGKAVSCKCPCQHVVTPLIHSNKDYV